MKVFLSWSGHYSKSYSLAFKKLLENTLQTVDVYISTDNKKGKAWYNEIIRNLQECDFMIAILTKENHTNEWINFEAGAIASRTEKNNCSAILVDLEPTDLSGPLTQLHHTFIKKDDIELLIKHVNEESNEEQKVKTTKLEEAYKRLWDDFEKEVSEIKKSKPNSQTKSTSEKLDDLIGKTQAQYHFLNDSIKDSTRLLFVNQNYSLVSEAFETNDIGKISKRHAEVLRLYFGIEREHSLQDQEIGNRFGLADFEVMELLIEGINKLKNIKENR